MTEKSEIATLRRQLFELLCLLTGSSSETESAGEIRLREELKKEMERGTD